MNNKIKIDAIGGSVDCMNRKDIPLSTETICDDIDINEAKKLFKKISIYYRDKSACPFNIGNWIIDFYISKHSSIPAHCMKLPADMPEEDFNRWVKPLSDIYSDNGYNG